MFSPFLAVQIEEEELRLKKLDEKIGNDKKKSVLMENKKVPAPSRPAKPSSNKLSTVPPKVNTNKTNPSRINPTPAVKKVFIPEQFILKFRLITNQTFSSFVSTCSLLTFLLPSLLFIN